MVIGFKPQFVEPILLGQKVHTIREDITSRWHEGSLMHMATGVRTKAYHQFAFHICKSVQSIELWEQSREAARFNSYIKIKSKGPVIIINEKPLTNEDATLLARNDGFESLEDFFEFFFPKEEYSQNICRFFYGRLLHWTDLKY